MQSIEIYYKAEPMLRHRQTHPQISDAFHRHTACFPSVVPNASRPFLSPLPYGGPCRVLEAGSMQLVVAEVIGNQTQHP